MIEDAITCSMPSEPNPVLNFVGVVQGESDSSSEVRGRFDKVEGQVLD